MVQIWFEWLESLWNGSNLHSNPFQMVGICIQKLQVSLSNGSNLVSNGSNPFGLVRICWFESLRMLRIYIRMVRISFEMFEFAFEWFESFSIPRICIRMLRIIFEWFKFAFVCFESRLNGLNMPLNLVRVVRICIRMIRIPFKCLELFRMLPISFKWFKFGFEWLESIGNDGNLHLHPLNLVRMIQICIWMVRMPFE